MTRLKIDVRAVGHSVAIMIGYHVGYLQTNLVSLSVFAMERPTMCTCRYGVGSII